MVHIARLKAVAKHLETVPEKDFDLRQWVKRDEYRYLFGILPLYKCGFAGCAMGWVAHDKLFEGFTIDKDSNVNYKDKYGVEHIGWDAICLLFDIPRPLAYHFFDPWNYDIFRPTTKDVIERINQHVAKTELRRSQQRIKELKRLPSSIELKEEIKLEA